MPDIVALICQWYGADELEPVDAIARLIPVLEFIAMPAAQQEQALPGCLACEVWNSRMQPLQDALQVVGHALPDSIATPLNRVWALYASMGDVELPCHDRSIFQRGHWQPMREAATQVLSTMGLGAVKTLLADLSR
ncbi:hypothetical protein [Pseudomonas sp. CAM1A]|uniref:hypothetical protein n=1 Tax=Pseudomonas sp. CAM1A TaxID=3231717 RepID=UPI0039C692B7